jgi:hypothetical protein
MRSEMKRATENWQRCYVLASLMPRDSKFGPLQEDLHRNHKVFFFFFPKYSEVYSCARNLIDFSLPKYFRELKKFSDTMSVV